MWLRLFLILLFGAHAASAQLNINNYIRVGQTRIQIGNYVGAIENFNIVIKFKPQLPEPYFFRGLAKHQLEDFRGAIADYDQAIDIKPYFPDAYINRGLAKLELQEYEAAIADYDKALELSPSNAGIYNNRGIARLSLKDVDGAIADYDKALELNPNFVNGYINRSNAYIIKGNIREAIRDLNRVVVLRPHFASVYLLRGLARYQLKDYAAALRDFDQTLRFDPKNAYAYNNRGIVKQGLEDLEGAIRDYDLALQLDPTLPNAYFNRGIAKETLKLPGYESDYQIALRLDPKLDIRKYRPEDPYERYLKSLAQQAQNQGSQGQVLAANATGQNPATPPAATQDSTQTADGKEAEEQERRRFRLALADTRNIPALDEETPDDGMVQNRNVIIELKPMFVLASFSEQSVDYERLQYYSLVLEKLNRTNNYKPLITVTNRASDEFLESFRNNIAYFDEKINREKTSTNYLTRGIFNFLIGRYAEALDDLNQSIDKDQKNMLAYFSRGNSRFEVVKLFESVPDHSENLTVTMDGTGNSFEAPEQKKEILTDYAYILGDYGTAIKLSPEFPFTWYNRAFIWCKMGKYEEAMADLDKAVELQPDFAEAYFNRGLIHIYMDQTGKGAMDLSKAGELGIEDAYNVIKRYCN